MIKKIKSINIVLKIKAINHSKHVISIGSRGAMRDSDHLPGRAINKVQNDVK